MDRKELALKKRKKGYNCSAAVLCAYSDKIGLDEKNALNLAEGFGGGIGGMHSVCGAVTGMLMAADLMFGNADPDAPSATKKQSYIRTKLLAMKFADKNGSMICADLMGGNGRPRLRSCDGCVEDAVEILEEYLGENCEKRE